MDDNAFKALTIGAATIMTMLTVSLVLIYYNTAKGGADELGGRKDIYTSNEQLFYNKVKTMADNNKGQVDGTAAKNIIFQYSGNSERLVVNLVKASGEVEVAKINQIKDKFTGQQDYLRINNLISSSDKFVINDLKINGDDIFLNLKRVNK
ncbi:MAG: hypothetical protein RR922_01170 [Clostridia bacterium]